MSKYYRALPYFKEVYEKYPNSPEAPKALYSAALCYYWMSGRSGYRGYIDMLAKRENYWQKGDALMLRIAWEYPNHELATSKKVLELLEKEKNK
jgi:hypothetical protein